MTKAPLPTTKDEMEVLKLQAEYEDLTRPWWVRSFGWGTVISVVSLLGLWYSGLINIQREKNDNQAILNEITQATQQQKMEANDKRLKDMNSELETAQSALDASQARVTSAQSELAETRSMLTATRSTLADSKAVLSESQSQLSGVLKELQVAEGLNEALSGIANMNGTLRVSVQSDEPEYRVEIPSPVTYKGLFSEASGARYAVFDEKLIQYFMTLPNLVEVHLTLVDVTDVQMSNLLSTCRKVEVLNIGESNNELTGAALSTLKNCPNLRFLSVDGVSFTLEQLESLANLESLELLSLQNCKGITAESLPVFTTFAALKELALCGNGISEQDAAAFRKSAKPRFEFVVTCNEVGRPNMPPIED